MHHGAVMHPGKSVPSVASEVPGSLGPASAHGACQRATLASALFQEIGWGATVRPAIQCYAARNASSTQPSLSVGLLGAGAIAGLDSCEEIASRTMQMARSSEVPRCWSAIAYAMTLARRSSRRWRVTLRSRSRSSRSRRFSLRTLAAARTACCACARRCAPASHRRARGDEPDRLDRCECAVAPTLHCERGASRTRGRVPDVDPTGRDVRRDDAAARDAGRSTLNDRARYALACS